MRHSAQRSFFFYSFVQKKYHNTKGGWRVKNPLNGNLSRFKRALFKWFSVNAKNVSSLVALKQCTPEWEYFILSPLFYQKPKKPTPQQYILICYVKSPKVWGGESFQGLFMENEVENGHDHQLEHHQLRFLKIFFCGWLCKKQINGNIFAQTSINCIKSGNEVHNLINFHISIH